MTFRPEHELHRRRLSRNIGLGVVLLVFVGLVYGLTVVKSREQAKTAASAASQAGK